MIKQALVNRSPRGQRAVSTESLQAPLGGWNARDPEAAMPKTDARWLENWWPGTSNVSLRKGATKTSTGLGGAVQSLMAYNSPATQKLFAASSSGIFDVTSAGVVGAPVFSVIKPRLNHVIFPALGATFLLAVNGLDRLTAYNGTTWQFIDDTTSPGITGVDTRDLCNICVFKRRIWFVEKDSLSAWYLPVNLVGGAALEFPIGQLCTRGGHLVAMASWTIDSGSGSDDNLVFITSEGEAIVYSGTDPNDADNFKLIGVYFIGTPMGDKCFTRYAGDLLVLTTSGLFPLSKALLSFTVDKSVAISNKIDVIFSQSSLSYGDNFGWSGTIFPSESIALFNVPTVESSRSRQLVMNTITGAWGLFSGWDAFCWETFDKKLYFGGVGFIARALVGYNDYGGNITGRAKGAFNYFGNRGATKHFTLVRPMMEVDGDVNINVGLDTDFSDIDTNDSIVFTPSEGDKWDEGIWDVAKWAGETTTKGEWRTVNNKGGFCAALRLQVTSKDVRVSWSSTDFAFRKGGVL